MCQVRAMALTALVASLSIGAVQAQSLRVAPVTIEVPPLSKSAFLTVTNEKSAPVRVQVRVFRWSLADGEDKLEKTTDVVVSPPMFEARAGAGNIVRVIRTSQTPVTGEETYRVFLEEIPDRKRRQAGTIALMIRQSIPIFFGGIDAKKSAVNWTARTREGKLVLEAHNAGDKRVKLSQLRVTDGAARQILAVNGLAGYVLGGQTKIWKLQLPATALSPGASLKVEAQTDAEPVNASVIVGKRG